MFLTIERLCERAGSFANHVRRYTRCVKRHQEAVVRRLEETGDQGRVSFGDPAQDLRGEMRILASVARGERERGEFLAFHYALQYIVMEVHCLDLLRYHLALDQSDRFDAYRRCIRYAQRRHRELSSAYLDIQCSILAPEHVRRGFVLLGVGTMGDRDDIDVAAVDDLAGDARHELSGALSRLSQTMLRTACTLHFHMAEAVGARALSASVEEFERLAERRPYDPVIISQLLHAVPLTGSTALAERLSERVTSRFRYRSGRSSTDHEGFLRGMMGEMIEMLQRPPALDTISPKEDGLRLIKGYLSLCRAIHDVPGSDWDTILDGVRSRHSSREPELTTLERGLTFLETTRYLHQVLVAEEEEIPVALESGTSNLAHVAERMGFERRGPLGAHAPFLLRYYEMVDDVRDAIRALMEPLTDHLRAITSLSFFFDRAELERDDDRGNLPMRHVSRARALFGTRFWNDLLQEFARKGSPVTDRYVRDLARLTRARRAVVMAALVEWGIDDVASFLRFLMLIRDRGFAVGQPRLFHELTDRFLERCRTRSGMAERLAASFFLWPSEIDRFLSTLDESRLARFAGLARGPLENRRLSAAGRDLEQLLQVHRECAERFHRSFRFVATEHPAALRLLRDPSELGAVAETLYGQAERFSDLFGRREWLEAYLHLQTVRLGLEFMHGRSFEQLVHDYRLSMHVLLRSLYFLCRRELYDLHHVEWSQRHAVGVYVEAGHRRFHPFEAQQHVLVFLFTENPEIARFFRQVVSSFHAELMRMGLEVVAFPTGDSAGMLVPRLPVDQGRLLEIAAEQHGDPLARLRPLTFTRIVGTQGHLRRVGDEVTSPLIAPVRARLEKHIADRLAAQRSRLQESTDDEPIDPDSMPGGLEDLELFQLVRQVLGGDSTMRHASAAGNARIERIEGAGTEQLSRNQRLLQILAAARRLLRGGEDPERIDDSFVRHHARVLELRPEIPDALVAAPLSTLRETASSNLRLMESALRD